MGVIHVMGCNAVKWDEKYVKSGCVSVVPPGHIILVTI